jgi:predicted HD superfamily hydrolase involved in NAD metabolism
MKFDVDYFIALTARQLTPHRFRHSLGVMHVMEELAPIYDLNKAHAMSAGILHDIAKEFTSGDLIALAVENNIALRNEHDRFPLFLHGPVGACYVAQKFGGIDPIILDAISRHSYFGEGAALSPSFCWCLRFADMLEPSRSWEELRNQLKPIVYSAKMGEAAYLLMRWIIHFHESSLLPVHPNMQSVFDKLSTLKSEERLCEVDHLPV